MRDLESIQLALTLAETGHLVFSTLHTNDSSQAIDRIIDVFPAWRQDQIRVQLGSSLGAVIAQRLVPRTDGGMVAAFEILIANHPVRNIIREGKTHQLPNLITTNQAEGMCSLESSLADLVSAQIVDYEEALSITSHPKELTPADGAARAHFRDCVSFSTGLRHGPRPSVLGRRRGDPLRPGLAGRARQTARDDLRPRGPQLITPFSEVLDQRPTFAVIALNAPVGYLDMAAAGGRTCDREARALLGPKRGSSIQSAPVRSSTNELEFLPDHLDAISMTLLPRYREVAAEMAPFRQRTVYEVHSDLSFYRAQRRTAACSGRSTPRRDWRSAGSFCERSSRQSPGSWRPSYPGLAVAPPRRRRLRMDGPSDLQPRPPSASPRIPNGTSRACGWRSSANVLVNRGRLAQCGRRGGGARGRRTRQPHSRRPGRHRRASAAGGSCAWSR